MILPLPSWMDVPTWECEHAPDPCRAQPGEQNQLPAPFRQQIQINCDELPAQLQLRQLPELHHCQISRQLRGLHQSGAQSSHIPHLRAGITHAAFHLSFHLYSVEKVNANKKLFMVWMYGHNTERRAKLINKIILRNCYYFKILNYFEDFNKWQKWASTNKQTNKQPTKQKKSN